MVTSACSEYPQSNTENASTKVNHEILAVYSHLKATFHSALTQLGVSKSYPTLNVHPFADAKRNLINSGTSVNFKIGFKMQITTLGNF